MRETYPDLLCVGESAFVSPMEGRGELTMVGQIRGDGENESRQDV